MAAYRRVYDSRHLQADCKEPGSAAEPYARKSSTSHLYLDREAEYCDDRVCLCVRLCVYVSARAYLQKHTSDLYQIFAPPPDRRAEYCNGRVGLSVFCVCVCPRQYLRNYTSDLQQILSACYLWPWLGPSPTAQ